MPHKNALLIIYQVSSRISLLSASLILSFCSICHPGSSRHLFVRVKRIFLSIIISQKTAVHKLILGINQVNLNFHDIVSHQ
jgi:hypothetical protein